MVSVRLLVMLVLSLVLLSERTTQAAPATQPNIIFFLSDDHRDDFLGCAGHPIVKTPTIDRLAAEGVRFRNAFVTTSICASSRATCFTGLWERSHKYTFGTPPLAGPLIERSYPATLKRSGYRTGFVGKFGVNVSAENRQQMFDFFQPVGRRPYFKKMKDGSRRHFTEIAGDRAIEFIKSTPANKPYCLSVSFNAAHAEDGDKKNHYPWPKEEDGLYDDVTIPPPLVSTDFWKSQPTFMQETMHRDRWFWRWDTEEKYQKNVRAYYRMITGLDRVMGRVLAEVERLGQADNTVVIFMGDNGYYKGSRGFAGKWSHFEESLRVPMVIYDPRVSSEHRGQVLDPMVLNTDIAATIVAAAGLTVHDEYQGENLLALITNKRADDWRTDFFCEHLMDNARIPKWEGVRGERYVYARYFEHLPEGEYLHDLKTDPRQLKNLAGDPKYADVLQKMRRRCDQLVDRYGEPYSPASFPTQRWLRQQAAEKKAANTAK